MGRRSVSLTNWPDVHIIRMPPSEMTYEERCARLPQGRILFGSIPNPRVAMMEGLERQGGSLLQATVVQVAPGFALSPNSLLDDCRSLGYEPGTLAHLIELFREHRRAFGKFRRIYAVDGVSSYGPGQPLMMPFIGQVSSRSLVPTLGTSRLQNGGTERCFIGNDPDGPAGFIFLEPSSHLDAVHCSGCNGK